MNQEKNIKLYELICQACENKSGQIPFKAFMELALYAPDLGYYQKNHPVFGSKGDYITATQFPLFGKTLSLQCLEVADTMAADYSVMEIGAGNGALAETLLNSLHKVSKLPSKYIIVERSDSLIQQQQARLSKFQNLCELQWHKEIPNASIKGLIIANELFDALPIHRIRIDKTIQEWYVKPKDNHFEWTLGPLSHPNLENKILNAIENISELPKPYDTEINLAQETILAKVSQSLTQGVAIFLDYGFPASEYYHHDRHMGTLMGHYKHHAVTCPLQAVGEQDITAHVDFTKLAQDAHHAGMDILAYTHQAHYLLGLGILEILEKSPTQVESQALQILTSPHEMGELFKILAVGKGFNGTLKGFEFKDFLYKL